MLAMSFGGPAESGYDGEVCRVQTNENNICLSYYEHQCAGICSSESRLEPIFESCLKDPLNRLAAALAEQGEELEDQ